MDKIALRRMMLARRAELSNLACAEFSMRIAERLLFLIRRTAARHVFLYHAARNEVATQGVIEYLLGDGRAVALPVVCPDGAMQAAILRAPDALKKGPFGLMEPTGGEIVSPDWIDLAVVPGVAFDRAGNRVGHGKGYYDRYLCAGRAPKVALAYDFQIVDAINADPDDVPMDMIITQSETIDCGGDA